MLKRDLIRLKPVHIVMIAIMFLLSWVLGVTFATNKYMATQVTFQKKLKEQAQTTYVKTTYIEKNIETFYNFINKSREFSTISMYDLKKEFSFLIPGTVKITVMELKEDWGTISGLATDFRTVDLISNTLKTYSSLYWTIEDVTVANSIKSSPTTVSFQISFNINKDKLKNKIYTDDTDGDWVQDFKTISIDVGWVKQDKKVINDECPFTPNSFVVIWKMLEQNPTLLDVYPKYSQMYGDWFFTLMENGCLKKWDYNILGGNN